MNEPTTIELIPGWRMLWDGSQVVLQQHTTRKRRETGEEYEDWAVIGYYGDWGAAGRSLLRRQMDNLGHVTIADFVREIRAAEERVTRAIGAAVGFPDLSMPAVPRWETTP